MPRQISPSNAWCFTLNNYTEFEYEFLSSSFSKESERYFYIIGKEVGESGTPHLQGYVALKDRKKKFRPLPKFGVYRGENDNKKQALHFERARGNREQNYKYCSKDGEFITNIVPNEKKLLHEELMRQKALALQDRIKALTERINETARDVNAVDDEGYMVLNELIGPELKEREILLNEFFEHDYDLCVWE